MKIVTYHYVRDVENSLYPGLKARSVETFKAQVDYCQKIGRIISADDFLESMENGVERNRDDILLTFDDGYRDHWEVVGPILEQAGVRGMFFIPTRAVGERKLMETNKIQLILGVGVDIDRIIERLQDQLDVNKERYGLKNTDVYWRLYAQASRFDDKRSKYIKNMLQFVLPEEVRTTIIDQLFSEYVSKDEASVADELYMTVENIKELQAAGMHIGNHGYNHVWLDKLTEQQQRDEIEKSLQYLRSIGIINQGWTMCYPYGAFNEATKVILKETNCRAAFTTKGGEFFGQMKDKQYEVNRMDTNEVLIDAVNIR